MTCAALVRSQRAAQPIPLGKDGGWQQHWAFVHHGSDDCQVSRWKRVENIGWLVGWLVGFHGIPCVQTGEVTQKLRNENLYGSCQDLGNPRILQAPSFLSKRLGICS